MMLFEILVNQLADICYLNLGWPIFGHVVQFGFIDKHRCKDKYKNRVNENFSDI